MLTGDFNGDAHTDLLCHDASTGEKWVIYAYASWMSKLATGLAEGTFPVSGVAGVTSAHQAIGWCLGTSPTNGVLQIADFNGDGADDLFCQDTVQGREWIDYADPESPGAPFPPSGTSSITGTRRWCYGGPTWRALVADVSSDRRADVICHDAATGHEYVAYGKIAH
jgi:hypothetical protein